MEKNISKLLTEIERFGQLSGNKKEINESSLSRVWKHTENFDVAIITAFRGKKVNCIDMENNYESFPEGHEYTKEQNLNRNKDLSSVLLQKGYGITKVKGSYIENFETPTAKEVGENSFFVVNRNDDKDFFEQIIKLAKFFCQDSVLLKPKGDNAFLYGSNNGEFPGLDNKFEVGEFKGGKEAEFMSRVGGRSFHFGDKSDDTSLDIKENYNNGAKFIISQRANKILSTL